MAKPPPALPLCRARPGGRRVAAPQRSAQQSTYKEAKLEGGLETMVPLFIATGDVIRVDTRNRKYVGKD